MLTPAPGGNFGCGNTRWNHDVASEATTIASGGGLTDRYAAALYAHADDLNALDSVVAEMESLGRLIDQSADLRRLLDSPLIDVGTASKAVLAVLDGQGFGKAVKDFEIGRAHV